jgi:D-alanyl-D-alanine dipeptidase
MMKSDVVQRLSGLSLTILLGAWGALPTFANGANAITLAAPAEFVDVQRLAPSIQLEMRYSSDDNFVGERIEGYEASVCYLAKPAAEALAALQQSMLADGFSLMMFDCYRPQRAVDHFVRWSIDPSQTTKNDYYPRIDKSALFDEGYIAHRSGHTRGSTIDVGLIRQSEAGRNPSQPNDAVRPRVCQAHFEQSRASGHVDFGSDYDCFDELSHTNSLLVSEEARANRAYLVKKMSEFGFVNYDKEWWHFTFKPERFPNTYFDFPIRNQTSEAEGD